MRIYNKLKMYLGLLLLDYNKIIVYNQIKKSGGLKLSRLINSQNNLLRNIIDYSYNNIPYYKNLFDSLQINPKEIKHAHDLYKLPILTKKDIIDNYNEFAPKDLSSKKFKNVSTGGSTGIPLKYRMSKDNLDYSFALLLRGLELAGYNIGDKIVVIAGGSLVSNKVTLKQKIKDYIMNFRRYSVYGMNEDTLKKYVSDIIKWQPQFIRGYTSSVFLLAQYVSRNKFENKFNLKAVITTSEMLLKNQRSFISNVFGVDVYDTYGLNDGALTAFECEKHNGMHIDLERGLLECVDENGKNIYGNEGRIIATTLIEECMPLIRYDTGDLGVLTKDKCDCGCERPLLKGLKGRVTDILKFNGKFIGSPIITVLMGNVNVLQYQFIQIDQEKLIIKIIKSPDYTDDDEIYIKNSLVSHVDKITIRFEYVETLQTIKGDKHKFIVNMLNNK